KPERRKAKAESLLALAFHSLYTRAEYDHDHVSSHPARAAVVAGHGDDLHTRRLAAHPAGHRRGLPADPGHPRPAGMKSQTQKGFGIWDFLTDPPTLPVV